MALALAARWPLRVVWGGERWDYHPPCGGRAARPYDPDEFWDLVPAVPDTPYDIR